MYKLANVYICYLDNISAMIYIMLRKPDIHAHSLGLYFTAGKKLIIPGSSFAKQKANLKQIEDFKCTETKLNSFWVHETVHMCVNTVKKVT